MVESVPFCGVFIETIRGKVLVAVPGLIPQEELCPLETPQSTEPTVFSENTKWFWKHVKYCKVSSDYYFVSNCLFVFVLFSKGVLGNLTYLKSSFASALPVISTAVKWWKRHGCIICSPLGIHISVNSRGAALPGGFVDTVSFWFCSLYSAAAFRNAALALISADLYLWVNPTEIKCGACAQVLTWARVPVCEKTYHEWIMLRRGRRVVNLCH